MFGGTENFRFLKKGLGGLLLSSVVKLSSDQGNQERNNAESKHTNKGVPSVLLHCCFAAWTNENIPFWVSFCFLMFIVKPATIYFGELVSCFCFTTVIKVDTETTTVTGHTKVFTFFYHCSFSFLSTAITAGIPKTRAKIPNKIPQSKGLVI